MKNLLKKLIERLIKIFSTSPVPSPSPTRPVPSPTPPINPVTVMVTNRDGQQNIIGVKINNVLVNDMYYPVQPMGQSIGTTKQLKESTTVVILFDGVSVNEQIVVGNACVDTRQSEMCIVDYVNTIYGVTIHYQNVPCVKPKSAKGKPRKKKTK